MLKMNSNGSRFLMISVWIENWNNKFIGRWKIKYSIKNILKKTLPKRSGEIEVFRQMMSRPKEVLFSISHLALSYYVSYNVANTKQNQYRQTLPNKRMSNFLRNSKVIFISLTNRNVNGQCKWLWNHSSE